VLLSLALCVPGIEAHAACSLKATELPVTMSGLRPLVPVKINGVPLYLIVDSGAFSSVLSAATAARLRLPYNARQVQLEGVAGDATAAATTVRQFAFAGSTWSDMRFLVGGTDPGGGAAGLLGQNVLHLTDIEYDFANGVIRLMRAEDCGHSPLAYWARTVPYSVIDTDPVIAVSAPTRRRRGLTAERPSEPVIEGVAGTAYLNGVKIRVLFDTGSEYSLLTLATAARAGVKPGGPGVEPAGSSFGIGRDGVPLWIGQFESFRIGEEQTLHTRLRFGALHLSGGADMLLGADFFLSHRIYMANGQHRLYFTYNGGPVFNLTGGAADSGQPKSDAADPTDAAGFSRRASAFAARRQFARAIADLTRAVELDPTRPDYFYERGLAYYDNKQPQLALADFDRTLKLKPDSLGALVARAEVHLGSGDFSAASADLDAAARSVPQYDAARLIIAADYTEAERFNTAVVQYNLWIAAHSDDARLALALNGRCWARALGGLELKKAEADCNRALALSPQSPAILESRALVRLRAGEFAKSLADYEEALHQEPAVAWGLYGRGIDELRLGKSDAGQADIAAAVALEPTLAQRARRYGIAP
jgi:tetratricopeptide (TPR) repeat protein